MWFKTRNFGKCRLLFSGVFGNSLKSNNEIYEEQY